MQKDIEELVERIPYKVWAECKKYSNSIGLQKIGKNVIIVLSEGVNELYFFHIVALQKVLNIIF